MTNQERIRQMIRNGQPLKADQNGIRPSGFTAPGQKIPDHRWGT